MPCIAFPSAPSDPQPACGRLAAVLCRGDARSVLALAAGGSPTAAPELRTADDEFSRQLSELKKTFADLGKKIEDSAADHRSPQQRRSGAQGNRGAAGSRRQAARRGRRQRHGLEPRRQGLEPRRGQAQVARAGDALQAGRQAVPDRALARAQEPRPRARSGSSKSARKDFAELLRKLQTSEDFIDELLQIREHQRALDVIHKLTDGIRDASDKLKKLLGAIKTPGA